MLAASYLICMKERTEKIIDRNERNNADLDFVNYEAQEAILNPDLPNDIKDQVVRDAIRKIKRIGERRAAYQVRHDGKPHDIYQA